MRRPKGPGLLVEVLTELGAGHVYERFISDTKCFVHGETTGRRITINPAIAIVDTCLHEALHAVRPNWSENYVRNRTSWLMRRMSDEQIQALYETYQRKVKRRKRGLSANKGNDGSRVRA